MYIHMYVYIYMYIYIYDILHILSQKPYRLYRKPWISLGPAVGFLRKSSVMQIMVRTEMQRSMSVGCQAFKHDAANSRYHNKKPV